MFIILVKCTQWQKCACLQLIDAYMWSNFWIEIHITNSQNVHKLLAVFSANGNQLSFRHTKYDVLLQYYQRYDKTLSTFAFLRIQMITYLTFTCIT